MPAELLVLGLHALVLAPGYALLRLLGLLPSRGPSIAAASGLAYLAGVAILVLAQVVLLPFGVPVTLVVPAAVGIGVCGAAAMARRPAPRPDGGGRSAPESPVLRRAVVLGLGVLGVVILIGVIGARSTPIPAFDAWAQWMPKTQVLAQGGLSDETLFVGPAYSYVNPDYPLALPAFEATQMRALGIEDGSPDLAVLHVGFWLILAAFAASLVYLRGRRASFVLVGVLAVWFAAAPGIQVQAGSTLVDLPMAVFLALGAMLLVTWLDQRAKGPIVLAGVFLGMAANLKNEGLAAAVVVCAATMIVLAVARDRRGVVSVGWLVLAVGALVLPWRVWASLHDVHGALSLGNGLDPAYLADHVSRVGPTLSALAGALARPGEYLFIPAAALALIVAVIVGRGPAARRALLHLAFLGSYFAVMTWAYWVSTPPLASYLGEAGRYMTAFAALSLVAIVDLARAWGPAGGQSLLGYAHHGDNRPPDAR